MRSKVSSGYPLVLVFLIVAAGLSGCKSHGPSASSSDPAAPMLAANASAVELYNAHRYTEARAKAETEMLRTTGRDKEVNQLTAGLSAYAMGQPALAEHYLETLTGSSDPAIAGRAEAVLGQIAEKKGNHQYAADLFKRASAHLDGDDAAKAAVRAGSSLAEVGRPTSRAAAATTLRAPSHANSGPYTIQVGAFSTLKAAGTRAREMTPRSEKAGLGTPRIVPDTIHGKPGFTVQVGTFAAKQAAINAKSRLGSGFVVAMD